jgi:hypothetical protein
MNAFAEVIVRGIWPNGNHLSAVLRRRERFWQMQRIFRAYGFL